jgi:hypothetical protein
MLYSGAGMEPLGNIKRDQQGGMFQGNQTQMLVLREWDWMHLNVSSPRI